MKEMNAKEALKLVEAGEAELCDVRTREEWQEDGLPDLDNLLKITWQGDPQGFLDELNENVLKTFTMDSIKKFTSLIDIQNVKETNDNHRKEIIDKAKLINQLIKKI